MIVKYSTGKINAVYPDKDKGAKTVQKKEGEKSNKKVEEKEEEKKLDDSN